MNKKIIIIIKKKASIMDDFSIIVGNLTAIGEKERTKRNG